jgi:GNAT superfamily N-acetyltransferase
MARHELWVELADRPGNLAALAGDLAACGANIVHLDVHPGPGDTVIDRLVVHVPDRRSDELAGVAERCGATLRRLDEAEPPIRPTPPTGPDGRGGPGGPAAMPARRAAPPGHPCGGTPPRRPPMTLERLVALTDGGLVRLRHLSSGDRSSLVAHHQRCSEPTRRHSRFLAPEVLPATGDDRSLVGGDGRRVALAALVGAEIAGVARYDVDDGGALAHLAVVVEDRHQRRGIGALLVGELAVLAANADVRHLRAVGPAGGEGLTRTLRRAGLTFTVRREGTTVVLDCGLPHGLTASA